MYTALSHTWSRLCTVRVKLLKKPTNSSEDPGRRTFTKKLGKRLRELRIKDGRSQEELALAAGLYRTYIGHIETGTYSPSVYTVSRIAKALKVSLSEVLKGVE